MQKNSVKENGLCWWLKEMSSAILLKSAESQNVRTKKAYGNDLVYNSVWFFSPSLELRFTVLNNRLAFRMNALNHFRKPVFLLGL